MPTTHGVDEVGARQSLDRAAVIRSRAAMPDPAAATLLRGAAPAAS